jgi:tetratricopeptide (TPR) repeat protein
MSAETPRWDGDAAAAILRHLNVILGSPSFVKSKRLGAFLRWVVEQSLAGNSANMTERAIGIAVYQRGADFDPKADATVRSEAMRLRHKLLEFYSRNGGESAERIEIPKGTYAPQFSGFDRCRRPAPIPLWRWAAIAAIACMLLTFAPARRPRGENADRRAALARAVAEGSWRLRIGDHVAAKKALLAAAEIAPQDAGLHLDLSIALQNLNLDSQAAEEARRAAELSPAGTPAALEAEAQRRSATRDWTGAAEAWRALAARNPRDPELLLGYARVQLAVVDPAAALHTLRQVRNLTGGLENPELDRMEGLALGHLGRIADATEVVLRGERAAESLGAQSALARLTLLEAGLRQNSGDLDCIPMLERVRHMCGNLGDEMCVVRTLRVDANRLVTIGRYREALALYYRALPVAFQHQCWAEIGNLLNGVRAAVHGLGEVPESNELAALSFPALLQKLGH